MDKEKQQLVLPEFLRQTEVLLGLAAPAGLEPNVKCYYLTENKTIVGIEVVSADKSFVVLAGVRMVSDNSGKVRCVPVTALPTVEVFQSTCILRSLPTEETKVFFYLYMLEYGEELMPEYMTRDRIEFLTNSILSKPSNAETVAKYERTKTDQKTELSKFMDEYFDDTTVKALPRNASSDSFYIDLNKDAVIQKH